MSSRQTASLVTYLVMILLPIAILLAHYWNLMGDSRFALLFFVGMPCAWPLLIWSRDQIARHFLPEEGEYE